MEIKLPSFDMEIWISKFEYMSILIIGNYCSI